MAELRRRVLPRRPLRRVGGPRNDAPVGVGVSIQQSAAGGFRVSRDYASLPDDLPVPIDDGASGGLVGRLVPDLALPSTSGDELRPADLATRLLVAFVYPMTGTPGRTLPHGWDDIPGARGCTPQSCAYRDARGEFERLGSALVGISGQTAAEQAEFAAREHIPFPLLSDDDLRLAAAPGLPTFEVEGRVFYRRLTFVAAEGRIVKAFYPVFPPDRDAGEVLAWLRGYGAEPKPEAHAGASR
jgi:peroxiredoxin